MNANSKNIKSGGNMEINNLEIKAKRDFNNAISLMSIIPLLAFVYLAAGKAASFDVFAGENAYVMIAILLVVLLGIFLGRQVLWALIKKILQMQKELIEKNRLAAITETVLTLGHEINNPLLVMQGNLDFLDEELKEKPVEDKTKNRVTTIKANCERIMHVTEKLSSLEKPVLTQIHGKSKMIDLNKSS